jgi:hypothetical protein
MKTLPLALAAALLAGPALAQMSDEQTRAYGVIAPMLQELTPDAPVLAACVVTVAAPEEVAAMAAGPSAEAGAVVSAVLARAEAVGCIQATMAQR